MNSFCGILQRWQWIGRDRSHRTAGDFSGYRYAATCQRCCHISRRFSVPIKFPEFAEQSSSQHEPADEYTEYAKPTCWSGNYEVRTEENDQRFKNKSEWYFLIFISPASFEYHFYINNCKNFTFNLKNNYHKMG